MKKLYLDANVVLRFLVGEPADMAEEARKVMEEAENGQVTLRLQLIVLAEVYWVLSSYYEFSRSRIDEVLSQFVRAQGIRTEKEQIALEALHVAADRNVDFIDALLASRAKSQDESVVTFDESDFDRLGVAWVSPANIS